METRKTLPVSGCKAFLAILLSGLALLSCQTHTGGKNDGGDTLELRYARNLLMVQYADGLDVQLRNPWDTTRTLHRYWLTEIGTASPFPGSTTVNIPLHRAGVFTAVHASLIYELGCLDAIAGICEPEYIHNDLILQRMARDGQAGEGQEPGTITDLGSGMNPNLERIMQVNADAVMPSPFQDNGGYGRLESIGIPIIECADYMEVSPLARTEWIRFYGRLFGVADRADSLFGRVEKEYLAIRKQTEGMTHRPTLMVDRPYSGTWYTPGGQSTMGILYRDAGAEYLWADTHESGSLSLSPEYILERAIDADIWLLKYNQDGEMTYDQLRSDLPLATQFKAFRKQNIYACNTHDIPFYEDTPFHPERLLADLLQIFHPELSVSAKYSYFCRMKE